MVEGEQIWQMPSLDFRGGLVAPALVLFAERARAVIPQFRLASEAEAVSDICRRLDGIPLAIELAAARIRVMSSVQIRNRLDDRFRLFGSRRAMERHQTLRHAVQWSYDLLVPAERILLARCSVFAGGFTLEAVEYACSGGEVEAADVLDLLDSLMRKSLVTAERSDNTMRYGLLETRNCLLLRYGFAKPWVDPPSTTSPGAEPRWTSTKPSNMPGNKSKRHLASWATPRHEGATPTLARQGSFFVFRTRSSTLRQRC